MVGPTRGALRSIVTALLASGLTVLAAAMVVPGNGTARAQVPAIHPAAEITPNSLPRSSQDPAGGDRPAIAVAASRPPAAVSGDRPTGPVGRPDRPVAPVRGERPDRSAVAGDRAGAQPTPDLDAGPATHHAAPDAAIGESVRVGLDTRTEAALATARQPTPSAPVTTGDGRAPPATGAS